MDATKIVLGGITIIIGLVLLPLIAGFTYGASHYQNATGVWKEDTNVTGVSGLTSAIDLVLYAFSFGLLGVGVALIWLGFKE